MARPKATLALSGLITPWSTMAHLLPRLPKPRLGALRAYSTQLSNAVPLVIHGTYQSSSDGSTFTVTNPRTLSPIGTSAAASSADCLSAIRSADAAYAAWEATPPTARRDIFLRAADVLAQPAWRERVLETMHAETDASEFWVDFNWKGAVGALRTTAGLVNELAGRAYKSAIVPGAQVLEQKRAMGVMYVFYLCFLDRLRGKLTTLVIQLYYLPVECANRPLRPRSRDPPLLWERSRVQAL